MQFSEFSKLQHADELRHQNIFRHNLSSLALNQTALNLIFEIFSRLLKKILSIFQNSESSIIALSKDILN
jgi:hypothetical protein